MTSPFGSLQAPLRPPSCGSPCLFHFLGNTQWCSLWQGMGDHVCCWGLVWAGREQNVGWPQYRVPQPRGACLGPGLPVHSADAGSKGLSPGPLGCPLPLLPEILPKLPLLPASPHRPPTLISSGSPLFSYTWFQRGGSAKALPQPAGRSSGMTPLAKTGPGLGRQGGGCPS